MNIFWSNHMCWEPVTPRKEQKTSKKPHLDIWRDFKARLIALKSHMTRKFVASKWQHKFSLCVCSKNQLSFLDVSAAVVWNRCRELFQTREQFMRRPLKRQTKYGIMSCSEQVQPLKLEIYDFQIEVVRRTSCAGRLGKALETIPWSFLVNLEFKLRGSKNH